MLVGVKLAGHLQFCKTLLVFLACNSHRPVSVSKHCLHIRRPLPLRSVMANRAYSLTGRRVDLARSMDPYTQLSAGNDRYSSNRKLVWQSAPGHTRRVKSRAGYTGFTPNAIPSRVSSPTHRSSQKKNFHYSTFSLISLFFLGFTHTLIPKDNTLLRRVSCNAK